MKIRKSMLKVSPFLMMAISGMVIADSLPNIIRVHAPIASGNPWYAMEKMLGDWKNVGSASGCTLLPLTSSYAEGTAFTQQATGCTQHQTQVVTNREKNYRTGEVRISGTFTNERILSDYVFSQIAYGTNRDMKYCVSYGSGSYWEEYRQDSGRQFGFVVSFQGKFIHGSYSTGGNPIYSSISDETYTYTPGAFDNSNGSSNNNTIRTYAYGVCRSKI